MGLRNHPHSSASFPTVTFGKENKSTPSRAFTEGDDERIGFDDQPGPVRIVAANAQASPCLGSEDFNDPEPRWAREQQSLMLHFCFLIDGVEFCIHGPGFA